MKEREKNLRKNIGKKIKIARAKSEYTQEELAEKASLSTRYISQLERGIAFGSASTIASVCNALDISPDFLFEDIVQNDSPSITDIVDNTFLENYLKLDKHHRKIINTLAADLVKLQSENKSKN